MEKILILLVILAVGGFSMCSKSPEETKQLSDFDAMWDYSNPKQTEIKFRELIAKAKESGDVSYYAQLLTQIARTQGIQSKFDDAHKTLDAVEAMLTDELVVARIRYLLERGRAFNSSNYKEKAKPFFLEAWELALAKSEDYYAVDAAHMMGIVEPPEKQLEWSLKALELTEKTTNKRAKGWLGPLYNNIGWTYHDLKKYDRALELFEKGLKWREEINDEKGVRIQRWNVARTYRSLGRIEEALEIQIALEKEIEEKGTDPDGFVFEELGECLLLKGKKEEAKDYFKRAYNLLSKLDWLTSSEPERLERMKKLGE